MGGKPSKTPKTELNRTKSFSSFGRSSQRSAFQKSKARLTEINKKLKKYDDKDDSQALDDIQKQLEIVYKDLNEISQAVKEKNKEKYEDVFEYFQLTYRKFEDKTKPTPAEENSNNLQECPKPENVRQPVELTLVKVIPTEDPNVELRKPLVRENSEENTEPPRSPKVKFGIQVMPINPRVSQDLLKRKTLPTNEAPKAEFLDIRKRAESDINHTNMDNELYDYHIPNDEEIRPASFITTNELYEFPPPRNSAEHPALPSWPNFKSKPENPFKELKKRQVNVNAIQQIESISKEIDVLEDKLKYFHGIKGDGDYIELNEHFVKSLIKLDNVDAQGDSVVRQERKIAISRIQELLKILECLVKQTDEVQEPNVADDSDYDYLEKRQEKAVNASGKPITATAL